MSAAGRESEYPPAWPRVDFTKPARRRIRIILATLGSEMPSARATSGIVRLSPLPSRPTRSRHRSPYSSWEVSFIGFLPPASRFPPPGLSHHPELQLRRIGEHREAPGRIEDDLDVGLGDAGDREELAL